MITAAHKIAISKIKHYSLAMHKPIVDSNALFTQGDVVIICHQGQQYSLRRTKNDKLILTK